MSQDLNLKLNALIVKTIIWQKITPNQEQLAENHPRTLNKALMYMPHLAYAHMPQELWKLTIRSPNIEEQET